MIARLLSALLAASTLTAAAPQTRDPAPAAWMTNADGTMRLSPVALGRAGGDALVVRVDPSRRYQRMVGFGASITDASAILIAGLRPAARDRLMQDMFGRGEGQLALGFTRLTIGASDFSPRHYSFDDMPRGQRDPALRHFSIAPNRADVLPVVKQAVRINPGLVVMASPWSPPGWMKTSGSMTGGTLRPDAYAPYARYFLRYLSAYAAEGVRMRYVTIQNEPDFSPADYPGMKWPAADRARFVRDHLGPALARSGGGTQILEWDHNWDQPQQPLAVLSDPRAARYVAGVAWHCYGGDVAAQSKVRDAHPGKDVFFTECSGGGWRPGWKTGFSDAMRGLMIGSTRNWARGVLFWNLALDPKGGPHLGGCGNCRGVVTIDPATGGIERNLEYYALGHLSRFVKPGAERIESSHTAGGIETVAFRNPDASLVLLAFNAGDTDRRIAVDIGAARSGVILPSGAAVTLHWRP